MSQSMDVKIKTLQVKLDGWKFIDEKFIPEDLRPFAYNVIHLASWLDILLDTLIGLGLTMEIKDKLTEEDRMTILQKSNIIVTPLNFERKLNLAKDLKVVSGEFVTKITKVMNLKNAFSHPQVERYSKKISELADKNKLFEEMKNLYSVIEDIESLKAGETRMASDS